MNCGALIALERSTMRTPDRVQEASHSLIAQIASARDQAIATVKELEDVASKVRDLSGDAAVSHHAKAFKAQADEHAAKANTSLKVAVVLGLLLVLGAILAFGRGEPPKETEKLAVHIIFRAVLISIGSVFLGLFVRNYRANQHNYITNRHRQLSLESFEAFVNATTDQATKDVVLQQATQTVFAATHTGFLDVKDPEVAPHQTIVEILRSTGKRA
jgi:hypothetical protein